MTATFTLRPATVEDLPFLWDMLFESAFTTEEQRAAWRRDPVHPPELRKYLDGWIRPGDAGFVAVDDAGVPAGAAWYRIFTPDERGDGVIARQRVPELAIAVEPRCRRHGVGAMLMRALARAAAAAGFTTLMLSVDPVNAPALALYAHEGYVREPTDDPAAGTSWIMVAPVA